MIKNYLKTSAKILLRNKSYSLLNILGLSLGITCALIIFLIIDLQLSYNQDNKSVDRTYRIVIDFHYPEGDIVHSRGVPLPLGAALRNEFPFLEKVAMIDGLSSAQIAVLGADNAPIKKFSEKNLFGSCIGFVEPSMFDIFDYAWLTPNATATLNDPNTAVITEKLAHKYFDNDNPIGKMLRVNNKIDVRITGVVKDIPVNTDLLYEIFISFKTLETYSPKSTSNWASINSDFQCFVVMAKNQPITQLTNQFAAFNKKYLSDSDAKIYRFQAQPLSDVHYNKTYGGNVNKAYLWAFALVGLFLIISACVNFINMATAQALQRSKEVGIRKVIGGTRTQLFWQFMSETAIITMLSVLLGVFLTELLTPSVNSLFAGVFTISLHFSLPVLTFLNVLSLVIIFLSGAYPALILSGFKPITALKGKISTRQVGGISTRRGLVVVQFFITQLLIICTIVIAQQMDFSKNMDLGFDKNGILLIDIPKSDKVKKETLRSQLSQIAGVEKISLAFAPPNYNSNMTNEYQYNNQIKKEGNEINVKVGDDNYLSTFGLQLVAGRNIQKSDTVTEAVVNEKFAQQVGEKSSNDVIGKTLTIWGKTVPIVGVVKDFHAYSTRIGIEPVCILSNYDNYSRCAVKLNTRNLTTTLPILEKKWNAVYPEYAYQSEWLDENIARFYIAEDIILRFIRGFSFIAILIGCLGLYGLVSFIATQKTKEIGIRKVLGASTQNILGIFSKEFIALILIAFAIAAPLSWWAMNMWLQGYVYRIHLGVGVFVLAISITLLIAAITIAQQAFKAAVANPVKSLRTE
jgi:putative ABC transport system permease protein